MTEKIDDIHFNFNKQEVEILLKVFQNYLNEEKPDEIWNMYLKILHAERSIYGKEESWKEK